MNPSFFTSLDPDVYKAAFFILILILIIQFLLTMLKRLLDHKLKNKIIEKGMSEELTKALLKTDKVNEKANTIKWFLILLSTGIGLLIVDRFPPLGIHSIAIVAISISLGFLCYSYYLKSLDYSTAH